MYLVCTNEQVGRDKNYLHLSINIFKSVQKYFYFNIFQSGI